MGEPDVVQEFIDQVDPHQVDPNQVDPDQVDPNQVDPDQVDPHQVDPDPHVDVDVDDDGGEPAEASVETPVEDPVEAAKESEAQERRRKLIKKNQNFTMISNIGSVVSIRKMKLRRTGGRNIPKSIRGRFRFI